MSLIRTLSDDMRKMDQYEAQQVDVNFYDEVKGTKQTVSMTEGRHLISDYVSIGGTTYITIALNKKTTLVGQVDTVGGDHRVSQPKVAITSAEMYLQAAMDESRDDFLQTLEDMGNTANATTPDPVKAQVDVSTGSIMRQTLGDGREIADLAFTDITGETPAVTSGATTSDARPSITIPADGIEITHIIGVETCIWEDADPGFGDNILRFTVTGSDLSEDQPVGPTVGHDTSFLHYTPPNMDGFSLGNPTLNYDVKKEPASGTVFVEYESWGDGKNQLTDRLRDGIGFGYLSEGETIDYYGDGIFSYDLYSDSRTSASVENYDAQNSGDSTSDAKDVPYFMTPDGQSGASIFLDGFESGDVSSWGVEQNLGSGAPSNNGSVSVSDGQIGLVGEGGPVWSLSPVTFAFFLNYGFLPVAFLCDDLGRPTGFYGAENACVDALIQQ